MSGIGQGFVQLSAAADYLGTGAIEIPLFEREILDMVRRSSVALRRFRQIPATGHPHRYFEQTDIARGAFTDPRSISPSAANPTRVERPAFIKAIVNQSNLGLFDREVTEQQGMFASVVAKDIDDIISGIEVVRAAAIWNGNDTSMTTPTTTQYMGGLSQITQTAVIAPGASIIDGIKSMIAVMVSNQTFMSRPNVIFVNPILGDYIDREAKASSLKLDTMNVVEGVSVAAINTQAGVLPLVPDAWMPNSAGAAFGFSAPPAGNKNYYAAIIDESLVEMPVISGRTFNPNPRIFQLGLGPALGGQYVAVKFDTIIFKGPSYAHAIVAVQRP